MTRLRDAINWLLDGPNRRRRQIDLELLWPLMRASASDIQQAQNAFTTHCLHDHAWKTIDEDEIYRIVEKLS